MNCKHGKPAEYLFAGPEGQGKGCSFQCAFESIAEEKTDLNGLLAAAESWSWKGVAGMPTFQIIRRLARVVRRVKKYLEEDSVCICDQTRTQCGSCTLGVDCERIATEVAT